MNETLGMYCGQSDSRTTEERFQGPVSSAIFTRTIFASTSNFWSHRNFGSDAKIRPGGAQSAQKEEGRVIQSTKIIEFYHLTLIIYLSNYKYLTIII